MERQKFTIIQTAALDVNERPPIPFVVRDYLEKFFIREVLEPKRLILNGKWNIQLVLYFVGKGKFGPESIFLAKGFRTVSSEEVRMYEAALPTHLINSIDPYLGTIRLMYDAVGVFLITTFKSVSKDYIEALWPKVDVGYLRTFEYPAAFADQHYIEDRLKAADSSWP